MRLCIVSPFPPRISGVGQYGWHIASGLAETGRFHSITVLAEHGPPIDYRDQALNGRVTIRRAWRRDDPSTALRLVREIVARRPHVVWFNTGMTMFGRSRSLNFAGLSVPALVRRAGIPVIVTLHEVVETARLTNLGLQNGRLTHWGAHLATQLLLQSDAVVVTLSHYANLLRTQYDARNVHHLPHGAFTQVGVQPHPADAPPLETLFFTSLAPHRGLPVLLEAFPTVQGRLPKATLAIAGDDHPRYQGYSAQVRARLNGQPGLRWLGVQTEAGLKALFANARVVALPYLATAGASSVLSRAAALGRPVVASDLPDIRATAEEIGLWVEWARPGDPGALAQALLHLLASPARQAAMAQHNVHAMRPLTLADTCARYADLLIGAARRG